MDLEEQIKSYYEIGKKLDELQEQKKALSASIIEQMTDKSIKIGDYMVRRYRRLSIQLSIDEARSIDAVKMEEAIDRDKIKTLHQQGMPISGVSESYYIHIRKD